MSAAEASTGRRLGEGATTAVPLCAPQQAEREGTHDPRSHQIAYSLPNPSCPIDCDILYAGRQISRSNAPLILEVELHHLHMTPSQLLLLLLIDSPVALQHLFGQGAKYARPGTSRPSRRWRIPPPVQWGSRDAVPSMTPARRPIQVPHVQTTKHQTGEKHPDPACQPPPRPGTPSSPPRP
jgi:hypothetical protein